MDEFSRLMYGHTGRRKKGSRLCGIRGGKDNFTKTDIVKYCAKETGITQKDCKAIIDNMVDFIKTFASDTDSSGKPTSSVTISGFGSFRTQSYKFNSKTPDGKVHKGTRKKMVFLPSSDVTSKPRKKKN